MPSFELKVRDSDGSCQLRACWAPLPLALPPALPVLPVALATCLAVR